MNMDQLQELYKTHAFLESSEAEGAGEAGAGAHQSPARLMEYKKSKYIMERLTDRTYEKPFSWYFVVFKPFDKTYEEHYDWYQHKGLDACRKVFKDYSVLILTKEKNAAKTHVNALVCTSSPPKDGKNTHKYKLSVHELANIGDRRATLSYILKESRTRPFEQYADYIYIDRNKKTWEP